MREVYKRFVSVGLTRKQKASFGCAHSDYIMSGERIGVWRSPTPPRPGTLPMLPGTPPTPESPRRPGTPPTPTRLRKRILDSEADSSEEDADDIGWDQGASSSCGKHRTQKNPVAKRARRSVKEVENMLNKRIELLHKQIARAHTNLTKKEEEVGILMIENEMKREQIKLLRSEKRDLSLKTNIPDFLHNTKREIESLERNSNVRQNEQAIDIENMDREGITKLAKALEEDWKVMHGLQVQSILERSAIGREFQCSMKQGITETAMLGPDNNVYDVMALYKYVETSNLTAFFWKDGTSGAEYMRVPGWRSPNTRQVFSDATFHIYHRAHNILNYMRDDISQDLACDFFKDIESYIHPQTMNMQQIAELFGKSIVRN